MRRSRLGAGLVAAICLVASLTGCTGGGPPTMTGLLTIVASPSLTDAITGMAHAFTTTYPGVQVQTVFESDSRIPDRAAQSPLPDLVAAEDPTVLAEAGGAGEPVHFALGQLVLAVPVDNPARLSSVADLARPEVRVALCDPTEPCGAIAAEVLAAAEVTLPEGVLLEPDVRSALHHVTEGTADAALVYRSDAVAAGDAVMTVEIPQSSVALADFVATVSASAPNPRVAQAFLDYLASPPVGEALLRDGFRPPLT